MLKDAFGVVLQKGDVVAFFPPFHQGLWKGSVQSFTLSLVCVEYLYDRKLQRTLVRAYNTVKSPNNQHAGPVDKAMVLWDNSHINH